MALEHVQECLEPFSLDIQQKALCILSDFSSTALKGVTRQQAIAFLNDLDLVQEGFIDLIAIYMLENTESRNRTINRFKTKFNII